MYFFRQFAEYQVEVTRLCLAQNPRTREWLEEVVVRVPSDSVVDEWSWRLRREGSDSSICNLVCTKQIRNSDGTTVVFRIGTRMNSDRLDGFGILKVLGNGLELVETHRYTITL